MNGDSLEVIFERVSPRTPSRRSESPICIYQTPTKRSKPRDGHPPDVIDLVSQEYESPTKLRRISSIEGLDQRRELSRTRKAPVIPSDSENSSQTSQVSEFGTLPLLAPRTRKRMDSSSDNASSSSATTTPNTSPQKLEKHSGSKTDGLLKPLVPIAHLMPEIKGWRILGQVSNKEELRQVKSGQKELEVFSFVLTDKDGGSIKINAWNEQAEKFHDLISDERGGNVRPVKSRQWNATGHEFELTLTSASRIESCDSSIKDDKLNLTVVPLAQISEHNNTCIDILAIVDQAKQSSAIKLKSNFTHKDMREIYLSDPTASLIKLTLWGKDAVEFDPSNVHKVVAVKGVLVKEYEDEFFLSTISGTTFKYDPEGPAADILQIWAYNDRPTMEIESFCTSFGKDAYPLDSPAKKTVTPSKFGQYQSGAKSPVFCSGIQILQNESSSQSAHQQHLNRTLADLTQDYARLDPRHTLQSLTIPELLAKLEQFQPSEPCTVFIGCKEVFGIIEVTSDKNHMIMDNEFFFEMPNLVTKDNLPVIVHWFRQISRFSFHQIFWELQLNPKFLDILSVLDIKELFQWSCQEIKSSEFRVYSWNELIAKRHLQVVDYNFATG